MEHITLKGTDLKVSPICLGTWQFNDGKSNIQWPVQSFEESKAIVDKCFEQGINFFDTAEGYAGSEEVLGKALEGRRQNAVVASKYGFREGPSTPPYSAEEIEAAILKSLTKLQTSQLDIIQIHFPSFVKDVEETITELNRQVALGRIRYYGLSNYGPKRLNEFVEAGGKPIVNQIGYNLLWRSAECALLDECIKHDVNMMAYSPLQQGLLTGKYSNLSEVPEGRRRGRLFSQSSTTLARHGTDGAEEEVDAAVKAIKEICTKAGVQMSKASLAWILQQQGIQVVIVGASSPAQIVENSDIVKLNADVVQQLTKATEGVKDKIGEILDQWAPVDRSN